ncbi:reverse transcriptase (RNA-dependent DNA polymerase) domain-containing protein [Hirsutella rhossiliensis]|uniref:Reverse transcriptase (RNA-dependent DNA polymerase) domain-containing protein n=1 Tax=Hirsutella rhossiliensis TaxID=111463 RepID=A0A9P8MIC5_9HYPO|nr:reverse transcriptase (RNA-dependent DNA polymerase) domain-containing protein [Hirsutella rhossiliensis]KAH0956938.1 reverse transcriptase (RNA-dependent DNA polymerase) domain-containing protein [Hirsutella rhossiliensis]
MRSAPGRTASVVVSGHTSEQRVLPQAGLPQGSPLSPIALLFFNADLVQRRINAKGGVRALVDDYSLSLEGIQSIIAEALQWERCSGATFEADKTTVIHFTRAMERTCDTPFMTKGQEVIPKSSVKLLGVVGHKAGPWSRWLERPPNGSRPHVFAKTEDDIPANGEKTTHPLASSKVKASKRLVSSMRRIASMIAESDTERMEIIHEYSGTTERPRRGRAGSDTGGQAKRRGRYRRRHFQLAEEGGVVHDTSLNSTSEVLASYSVTLGSRDEQNPYIAEIAAVAMALASWTASPRFDDHDEQLLVHNPTDIRPHRCNRVRVGEKYACQTIVYIFSNPAPEALIMQLTNQCLDAALALM